MSTDGVSARVATESNATRNPSDRPFTDPDPESAILYVGVIAIDRNVFVVRKRGLPVALTRLEFDILEYLARMRRVVSPVELLARVIKGAHRDDSSLVRVHISSLRRKLGANDHDNDVIVTVRGRGYMLAGGRDT